MNNSNHAIFLKLKLFFRNFCMKKMILLISLLVLSQSIFVFCAAPMPKVAAKASSAAFKELRKKFMETRIKDMESKVEWRNEQAELKRSFQQRYTNRTWVFGHAVAFYFISVYSEIKN
jgi:hypothetical protein